MSYGNGQQADVILCRQSRGTTILPIIELDLWASCQQA